VRLVVPLPLVQRIIRLSDEGELLSARRSPRRGRVEDIFNRLVSIPANADEVEQLAVRVGAQLTSSVAGDAEAAEELASAASRVARRLAELNA
jgi:hypothetical protein